MTPVPVVGDRVLLDRVVRNLAENAARHAGGLVAFSLTEDGPGAVLSVSDDGPGIPVDQREAVFERFHRLDAGRGRSSGGTGLGLAIARRIVDRPRRHHRRSTTARTAAPASSCACRLPTARPLSGAAASR